MNGPADMGGRQGFGPIEPEPDEPIFHGEWEKRALGLTLAAGALGRWTIDESRHARETLPPRQYLASTYYEIWIAALEKLLLAHALVSPDELASGRAHSREGEPALTPDAVPTALAKGSPAARDAVAAPLFDVGDRVRAKALHTPRHTRLPAYVWGHAGTVVRRHGAHVFPDTNAHGEGEQPRHLYNVRFAARDLFGDEHEGSVHLDLWEPYLERA